MKNRCEWAKSEIMIKYHDNEWGVPVHDDIKLFEMLTLEGAQAGLTWEIILKRREGYRKAFDNFDVVKISEYSDKEVQRLLNDKGIIRNKLKIKSTINNAELFLVVKKEFGSFDKYIWSFVDHKTIKNKYKKLFDIPSNTLISDNMSKDLKRRGFNFVGSTICYAFMQSVGMVNDHLVDCFRYK
ncbi:MAG: DNA-3-methyladenine glycosylase I [Candidatus Nanoarchaeia archaeon]|jgi:DNA-3-methyladenine glycosylase I|nr:DNA-3-methyladenine glycosylase I [Candidatus Nanoarchaeia archaeon]|tara:strand:- start:6322 stop:6873 length:552 start_codon:yes stop_codon:yes gene_type:complete